MCRLLFILTVSPFFVSCHNCICVPSAGLRLAFVSFDSAQIDTIIVYKFEKGSNFSHPLDTALWDNSKVQFHPTADTLQMGSWFGASLLQSEFDYRVFIPAVDQNFQITALYEPEREDKCNDKTGCVNLITSCDLNGVPAEINNEIVYLKK